MKLLVRAAVALILSTIALSTVSNASQRAATRVVEIVTFRLKEGVTVEQFQKVNKLVERNFVSKQRGFQSRESIEGENKEWLVVIHWRTSGDAQASMDAFGASPLTRDFMAMIDPETFVMKRYGKTI